MALGCLTFCACRLMRQKVNSSENLIDYQFFFHPESVLLPESQPLLYHLGYKEGLLSGASLVMSTISKQSFDKRDFCKIEMKRTDLVQKFQY
jgi:hypothetical protein